MFYVNFFVIIVTIGLLDKAYFALFVVSIIISTKKSFLNNTSLKEMHLNNTLLKKLQIFFYVGSFSSDRYHVCWETIVTNEKLCLGKMFLNLIEHMNLAEISEQARVLYFNQINFTTWLSS